MSPQVAAEAQNAAPPARHPETRPEAAQGGLSPESEAPVDAQTVTPPHGTRGHYRDHGCRCNPCREASAAYRRAVRARNASQRRATRPAKPAAAPAPRELWAFERHAAHPAVPAVITTSAPSVVCCEREVFEPEGSGHDYWCPLVTASNNAGGDAA